MRRGGPTVEILRYARAEYACRLRDAGMMYRAIGERLGGVCAERARQLADLGARRRTAPRAQVRYWPTDDDIRLYQVVAEQATQEAVR